MSATSRCKAQISTDGLIVLIPSRGQMCVDTHTALSQHFDNVPNFRVMVQREPVDIARNKLAATARKIAADDPMGIGTRNYLALWIDCDAWWHPGTIATMMGALRSERALDLLCGHFCVRYPNMPPALAPKGLKKMIAARGNAKGTYAVTIDHLRRKGIAWEPGQVNAIEGCGFHFVMHRVSVLDRLGDNPFTAFDGMAEDESFCARSNDAGIRMACHTGLNIAHIDEQSGLAFIPYGPALEIKGGQTLVEASPERMAAYVPDERDRSARKYGAKIDEHRRKFDEMFVSAKTHVLK